MPAYDFENLETGCIEERIMSYTKLEQFKKEMRFVSAGLQNGMIEEFDELS